MEELLRAYFLRAGFFVIRGAPFRIADQTLTDVDLWLYERPTGTSRRIQICDIKHKHRPRAFERILWTSGLARALDVDGAYVATTDKRQNLRQVAEKLDLQLIDGTDIQRIQGSRSVYIRNRITDEQLATELRYIDEQFRNKRFQEARENILSALSEGFGAPSAVRCLDEFSRLAASAVEYQPDSRAARVAGRLAYLAAAIACESLDYVSVRAAFRSVEERRDMLLNAVRLGALSDESGNQTFQLAVKLVGEYAPGGQATAKAMETALNRELGRIPAEIVADQAALLLGCDQLFSTGCELEMASYQVSLPPFDSLSVSSRAMLGALLDYARIDRVSFANSWQEIPATESEERAEEEVTKEALPQEELFGGN